MPAQARAPGLALGRKRPRVSDSAVDPLDQLLVGFQVLGADAQPSGHRAAAHDRHGGIRRGDQGTGFGGVNPDQGTTLTAGADRHIAAYQECQAAEHLPLGYARPGADQEPDPVGELSVVGHADERSRYLSLSAADHAGTDACQRCPAPPPTSTDLPICRHSMRPSGRLRSFHNWPIWIRRLLVIEGRLTMSARDW